MNIDRDPPARCARQAPASPDEAFIEMLRAYRRSGGIAREVEVLRKWPRRSALTSGPDLFCAPVICFEWAGVFWLPRFQFAGEDLDPRPGPAQVVSELASVFDGWEMALWFSLPNLWIGDARPIDLLDECFASVLGAARADRFIANS